MTPPEPLDDVIGDAPAADPVPGTVSGASLDTGASRGPGDERWPQGMIPSRRRRRTSLERVAMRLLATGGIIGVAVVLGATLVAQNVDGWLVGLIVGLTSVSLAAVLWSSKQL